MRSCNRSKRRGTSRSADRRMHKVLQQDELRSDVLLHNVMLPNNVWIKLASIRLLPSCMAGLGEKDGCTRLHRKTHDPCGR